MSEMSVTSSNLAITVAEKKTQRPGGCVGIFYQLFDWNRRLAKKKLFSKKLLPPDRAKRAAKKFGVDDKLPTAKHLLIADENRGGFPTSKKSGSDNVNSGNGERSHEMRSPSLVARLMGLESMPSVRREKPKKALLGEFNGGHRRNPSYEENVRCSDDYGCDGDEFRVEKGHGKMDSRPQKLQKTGVVERRSVTRFGAEALQFRSPLSRSKKQHHPKQLVSPVKSPRVGKGASRLMGAATKMLEPGLQASNRAKCSLTYSPTFHISSRDDTTFHITSRDEAIMTQEPPCSTLDDRRQTSYYPSSSKPLKEQPSCKSCGNWLDVVDSRPNVEEQVVGNTSSGLGLGSSTPLGPGRNKFKPPESFPLQGRDDVAFRYQGNRRSRNNPPSEMKHVFQEYQEQYHPPSHRVRYQTDAAPATVRNLRSKRQNQSVPKDRSSMKPIMNNFNGRRDQCGSSSFDGSKDFVSVNRNSASRAKISVPSKVMNKCIVDPERNTLDKKDDSSRLGNSIRKKRPITGSGQIENANINQSGLRKQRDDVILGRRLGTNGQSKTQQRIKKELPPPNPKTDTANNQKDIGVVSFTFSSPMKQKSESPIPITGTETMRDKKLTVDASKAKPLSHVSAHLRGDALGALLEEKLKELTCRDGDELDSGDCLPGRSTAAILEELIVALTAERPVTVENGDNCSIVLSQDDSSSCDSQDPSNEMNAQSARMGTSQNVKAVSKPPMVFTGFLMGGDGEYHSPGCVLDASFSNDSCFSESLDDYTGNKQCSESVESSYYQPQPSEYDAELSDCATSVCTSRTRVIDSLDNIQSVGEKFASEVIGNANLLLRSLCDERDFPVVPLLDNLEALSDAPWTTPNCKMGFMGCNGNSLQRRFLLDSLVEYLDSRCDIYWKSRFKSCPGIRVDIKEESLTREVHEEVQRWVELTGKTSEEILEIELNCSSDKWMDIEVLGFGIGMKMEAEIFQGMVDEMVIEFRQ